MPRSRIRALHCRQDSAAPCGKLRDSNTVFPGDPMSAPIEFYFDFASPYGYLASESK